MLLDRPTWRDKAFRSKVPSSVVSETISEGIQARQTCGVRSFRALKSAGDKQQRRLNGNDQNKNN